MRGKRSTDSGIPTVNANAEVYILNLNYTISFIFYSSVTRLSNDELPQFRTKVQFIMVYQCNFSILSDWSCMYKKLHKYLKNKAT